MKNVIITGATGMVGSYALDHCLRSNDVAKVTVIGRRSTGKKHDKLLEIIHNDLLDYSSISDHMKDQDVALFCIGVYTGAVPDDEFEKITVDYTKAFTDALLKENGPVSYCFLSGAGADRNEKSRMIFARSKGKAENFLLKQDFKSLHIFRPGYIYPVEKRKEPNMSYRITRSLWPAMRKIFPSTGINSDDLGYAIADVGINGGIKETHENKDILSHVRTMNRVVDKN